MGEQRYRNRSGVSKKKGKPGRVKTELVMISMSLAADYVERLGYQRPHRTTLWRWCRKGVRGVTLDHWTVGGKTATNTKAIDKFLSTTEG